jgi:hypothetical protein
MSTNKQQIPTQKKGFSVNNVFSIIVAVTAALCFLFLLTKGISYSNPNASYAWSDKDLSVGSLIFGTEVFKGHPNAGLLSAFILMVAAIVLDIAMNWFTPAGYFSFLFFVTAGILWFCAVPLVGVEGSSLAVGTICLGVFNLIDAVLVFIGVAYR